MALILNIETATKNCSVSLSKDGENIACIEENTGGYSHAERLHPFIAEVLKKNDYSLSDIDAVAISMGPGSYTGLRIGVSAAKGICYANDLPLIAVSTLESMANSKKGKSKMLVPMLDARRMEVYASVFSGDVEVLRETKAEIIDENSFHEFLNLNEVLFFGDGAPKCEGVIVHENAKFEEGVFPSAKDMSSLGEVKFNNKDFVDIAYFEPFYLKDFIGTKSLKRG